MVADGGVADGIKPKIEGLFETGCVTDGKVAEGTETLGVTVALVHQSQGDFDPKNPYRMNRSNSFQVHQDLRR